MTNPISWVKDQYDATTPKQIKRTADVILAATTTGGVLTVLGTLSPVIGVGITVLGALAKLASNLFSETCPEDPAHPCPQPVKPVKPARKAKSSKKAKK